MIREPTILFLLFFHVTLLSHSHGFWKFYGPGLLNDCIITADSSLLSVGSGFQVMKTDLNGDTIWTRDFPGTGGMSGLNEAFSVTETSDNYYLVCGYSGNASSIILRLIKIDSSGNLIWNKYYGAGGGTCVKVNRRGLYYISYVADPGALSYVNILETDTSGNIIWNSSFHLTFDDRAWGFDYDVNEKIS